MAASSTFLTAARAATKAQFRMAREIAAEEFKLFPEAVPIPLVIQVVQVLATNYQTAVLKESDTPRHPGSGTQYID